jgi:uncharacterized protein (DUF2062 family)
MVFRRRDRRPLWVAARDAAWPRRGWGRVLEYLKHRVRRLPDSPEKIGRGMAAGVFVGFLPVYGVHFLVALAAGWGARGNLFAALIGSCVNNFLTVLPISAVALPIGALLLGDTPDIDLLGDLTRLLAGAAGEAWNNLLAPFTAREAHWDHIGEFLVRAFPPLFLGGIVPGLVAGLAAYWVTVPLVRAYQNARRKALHDKLAALRGDRDGG